MTVTTSPQPAAASSQPEAGTAPQMGPRDACPLCGASLHPEQEWCLRCGGAARTRLAAAPTNWKAPVAALLAVIALSLGVLTAALVDLAGSGSSTPATTKTVTAPAAPAAAAPTPTAPTTAVPPSNAPGSLTPGATSTPGGAGPGQNATSPGSPARIR
ncbi:MAG: hypothetical protein JWO23_1539 [Solirubrobacterales bacterium]|nr:hypothetical protein [Solirubrobacterales bacterium]